MNDRKEDDEYKIINDEYENYEMTKLPGVSIKHNFP